MGRMAELASDVVEAGRMAPQAGEPVLLYIWDQGGYWGLAAWPYALPQEAKVYRVAVPTDRVGLADFLRAIQHLPDSYRGVELLATAQEVA